ncbi:MAG: putative baseplate assembly protein [Cyanobacteria bacterium P01_F01_bin.116]
MEFDFLPNLPKSDLDDRTYKDLVNECVLRIPRYCPEWTNHNPADPGITLIELFAWLTDQMLLRFNQVPRRNYVAFLEMLGIRLQPPTPAQTAVTFYLSRPQHPEERIPAIPAGTEVATERTETEEAIVFSTDDVLRIGIPRIRHLLTAEHTETRPQRLRDRLVNVWALENSTGRWSGPEQSVFQAYPQVGNCFYLVFDSDEPLDGNVIELLIEGEPAASTGINPDKPPRKWEAWDGKTWQPILLQESDDRTKGFSFDEDGQQEVTDVQRASVTLHMPLQWSATQFANYHGRWLRCVYSKPEDDQAGYSRSPKLEAITAHAVGGCTMTSQCTLVQNELLGESSGKPGQTFQLQSESILPRQSDHEYIEVLPPADLPQIWKEVTDFADSRADDQHYTLDAVTGTIQFGPLIREPSKLREDSHYRQQIQQTNTQTITSRETLERQYGAVPPKGATIRMKAYRTGGGQQGNVQRSKVRILKSAVPYVTQVVNHKPAINGIDAESLEEAVIRVPSLLRTRNRAVTAEDFETLTLQASRAVGRVHCPQQQTGGQVKLLVVPRVDGIEETQGVAPYQLSLSDRLQSEVLRFLDERRLLGIEVQLQKPDYVGVSVQAEVGVLPGYGSPQAKQEILDILQRKLYQFLNPLTGGTDGTGWPFGQPVYKSDIVGLIQQTTGVRYLGTVELFALRRQGETWRRSLASEGVIFPGTSGLICSWANEELRSGHVISLSR